MSGDTKRKNKSSASRPARAKVLPERKFDGIYSNARFVHIAASLVGHIVQVQVRDGDIFEGVFRTFSPELEIVLEMAHLVDRGLVGVSSSITTLLASLNNSHSIVGLMIFRLPDVVTLSAVNADLDFAIRDTFTDTAISKFNGQSTEKPLEPWLDGGVDGDGLPSLDDGTDGDETVGLSLLSLGQRSSTSPVSRVVRFLRACNSEYSLSTHDGLSWSDRTARLLRGKVHITYHREPCTSTVSLLTSTTTPPTCPFSA